MTNVRVVVEKNIRSATEKTFNFVIMNCKNWFLSFALFLVATLAFSQGNVEIIGESNLQTLIRQRVAGLDTSSLTGYRIQLFFGSNRNDAQSMQSKFNSRYPEWSNESYLLYFDPSWRVRVGNFYKKIDAQPMMNELQREYGNVFLIRDKIELPALRLSSTPE